MKKTIIYQSLVSINVLFWSFLTTQNLGLSSIITITELITRSIVLFILSKSKISDQETKLPVVEVKVEQPQTINETVEGVKPKRLVYGKRTE
jgi:hypothetical protein